MSHKVLLVSLLIIAVQSGLVSLLPLSDDITELHPVQGFATHDVDNNFSDEVESVTDFLENMFGSDDGDDSRRHETDSREGDGNDSKVTDFMENMFGDDTNARLATGGSSNAGHETDVNLSREVDSRENGSRSGEHKSRERDSHEKRSDDDDDDDKDKKEDDRDDNKSDNKSADEDKNKSVDDDNKSDDNDNKSADKDKNRSVGDDNKSADKDNKSDDKDNKSDDKDNKSADKDKNRSVDDDNKSDDKDDSATCPAYPVDIDDHQLTITTQNGCKIVIKLSVLLGDKDISVHDDKGRTVRTLELSYDE